MKFQQEKLLREMGQKIDAGFKSNPWSFSIFNEMKREVDKKLYIIAIDVFHELNKCF
jgi:hypothetical protein